jgi:hypothetical protein
MITRIRLIALIALLLILLPLTTSAPDLLAKSEQGERFILVHIEGASFEGAYFDNLYTHKPPPR